MRARSRLILATMMLASLAHAEEPATPWDSLVQLPLVPCELTFEGLVSDGVLTPAGRQWLDANAEFWPAIERAFADPSLRGPAPEQFHDILDVSLQPVRWAAWVGATRALAAAGVGRMDEARQELELTIGAMRRIEAAPGCLFPFLAALAGESTALRAAREVALWHALGPEWAALGEQCLTAPPTIGGFCHGLTLDFDFLAWGLAHLDELREDAAVRELVAQMRSEAKEWREIVVEAGGEYRRASFFQPRKTARLLEQAVDYAVEVLNGPRWLRDKEAVAALDWSGDAEAVKPYLLKPNLGGRVMIGVLLGVAPRGADNADTVQARRQLTAATVALRRYFDAHGRLPASLGALVEDGLLDAVPVDPFDGQPLRYDPDRRLLWSINRDETDDRGGTGDLAVALEFATP